MTNDMKISLLPLLPPDSPTWEDEVPLHSHQDKHRGVRVGPEAILKVHAVQIVP